MTGPLTIRWDEGMGCYRVSEPNFAHGGPVRVFREEDVRPLWEALTTISCVDNHGEDTATADIALDAFPAPEEWTA